MKNLRASSAWRLFGVTCLLLVCNGCGTLTELTSSADPSTVGSPVTFTASVAPPPGQNAGRILFEDGGNVIGAGTPNLFGQASLTVSNLTVGTHNIRAVFQGGGKYSGSTSNTVAQQVTPKPDIPVLETLHIPPVAGASGLAATDRVTSLNYSGIFFAQPADTVEFRLRAPWPTNLQVLIAGQQLQQVTPASPAPQPDDPGYYTVAASPMPGWPDKIDPAAPGYNWFFVLVSVKLPKQFRYQVSTTSLPGFTLTLRDVSADGQSQAADLNLPILPYPHPLYGTALPTPPSSVFLSGDNAKDRPEAAMVAKDVTLAGWLTTDAAQSRGNALQPCGSGDSEDWHFELFLDSDFVQRNYASNPATLANAIIPGYPEHPVCINCCHAIPLTGGLAPDLGAFLMPGDGLMGVELNSWHISVRGTNTPPGPAWFSDPNKDKGHGDPFHPNGCSSDPNVASDSGIPDPGASPAAALYPDNLWAFNVLTGTAFPPDPSPPNDSPHFGQLKAGDYVVLTGTLWEDIAHLISTPDPNRQCFYDLFGCQGGWLEIHPVDVVRYVTPPPPLRRHPEVVPLCAHQNQATFLSRIITPDDPPPVIDNLHYNLKFQEIVDSRFTDPKTVVEKNIGLDPCDPTKLDVNMEVTNPNGFAYYKSVILAWWEKGSTPRPQPNCAPKTYSFIEFGINTGDDDLRSDSAARVDITRADQSIMQPIILKTPGAPGWGNNTLNDQKFSLSSAQPASAFGNFVLNLIESDPNCRNTLICISDCCDTWKIQSVSVRAFNTSNGQKDGPPTDQLCLYNKAGKGNWQTLTRSASSVTLAAFNGCPTEAPPQFSLRSGTYICPQTVNLTDIDLNATIFFTTDGSTPTTSSSKFSGQLTINSSEVITAIASDNGQISAPSVASYTCHVPGPPEPVVCSVFDDGYTNMEGPSDAVFISGRTKNDEQAKACIPGGEFGHCHKWFGRCSTVNTGQPVLFNVFDDDYQNMAGPTDAIFISKSNSKACIPDGTTTGTCRRWFGRGTTSDGRTITCRVFENGYSNPTGLSDAIFIQSPIPAPGEACIPGGANGVCHRWFGQCQAN